MVPQTFTNYFLASAGASAALIGLLFVAVSIAPEHIFGQAAPADRRALAVSAFFALLDAFFVSITALIPDTNVGYPALAIGITGLINTVSVGRHFWEERRRGRPWRRATLLTGSVIIYGLEIGFGVSLIRAPRDTGEVYGLAYLLLGAYSVGVGHAWSLLGATNEGLFTLLGLRSRSEGAAPGEAEEDNVSPE